MVTLPSGRRINAHLGIVGISEALWVTHGYDGDLQPYASRPDWMDADEWATARKLTDEEAIELADIMIERWGRFRAMAEQRS